MRVAAISAAAGAIAVVVGFVCWALMQWRRRRRAEAQPRWSLSPTLAASQGSHKKLRERKNSFKRAPSFPRGERDRRSSGMGIRRYESGEVLENLVEMPSAESYGDLPLSGAPLPLRTTPRAPPLLTPRHPGGNPVTTHAPFGAPRPPPSMRAGTPLPEEAAGDEEVHSSMHAVTLALRRCLKRAAPLLPVQAGCGGGGGSVPAARPPGAAEAAPPEAVVAAAAAAAAGPVSRHRRSASWGSGQPAAGEVAAEAGRLLFEAERQAALQQQAAAVDGVFSAAVAAASPAQPAARAEAEAEEAEAEAEAEAEVLLGPLIEAFSESLEAFVFPILGNGFFVQQVSRSCQADLGMLHEAMGRLGLEAEGGDATVRARPSPLTLGLALTRAPALTPAPNLDAHPNSTRLLTLSLTTEPDHWAEPSP